MNDWKILALSLAFVAYMARLQKVNRRAMKFAGILVCALAGYSTVPLLTAGLAGPVQYSGVESLGPGPGPGGGGILSIFRRGGGTTPAGSVGPPNTPTVTALVLDTNTVVGLVSAFVGSGSDTQASLRIQVDTVTGDFSSPKMDSTQTGTFARDTLSRNAGYNADGTYKLRALYAGVAGGASAWSAPDTFVNSTWITPGPQGTDTVRLDTRAGGAQSIQVSATRAAALSAAGFSYSCALFVFPSGGAGPSCGADTLAWTTDYDGAGTNAFVYAYTSNAAAGDSIQEQDHFIYSNNLTGMRSGPTGSTRTPVVYQVKIHFPASFNKPGNKFLIVYRDGNTQDCKFTAVGQSNGTAQPIIFWDGSGSNPSCGVNQYTDSTYTITSGSTYSFTTCLTPETDTNTGDGQVAMIIANETTGVGSLVHNKANYMRGRKNFNGQYEPGIPTRTFAGGHYFQAKDTAFVYDFVAWQDMTHATCSDAVADWMS